MAYYQLQWIIHEIQLKNTIFLPLQIQMLSYVFW